MVNQFFNRLQQGRSEAFDAFVQFYSHGQAYVMQGLATAAINMLTVDVDRYDCFGDLFLIAAAQGHTLSLSTGLTSDLVLVRGINAGDMPAGSLGSVTLSAWIAAKQRGERIRALVRQVFVDRNDPIWAPLRRRIGQCARPAASRESSTSRAGVSTCRTGAKTP